jgi:hypothetical protein
MRRMAIIGMALAVAVADAAPALPSMKQRLAETWAARPGSEPIHVVAEYFEAQPDDDALALLAAMMPSLGDDDRADVADTLGRRAGPALQGAMELALVRCVESECIDVARYFARHPFLSTFAIALMRTRLQQPFDHDPQMTLAAAAMGDPQLLAWAGKRLAREPSPPRREGPPRQSSEPLDDRWLAVQIVAVSPLPEAHAMADRIVAEGREDFMLLIGAPIAR